MLFLFRAPNLVGRKGKWFLIKYCVNYTTQDRPTVQKNQAPYQNYATRQLYNKTKIACKFGDRKISAELLLLRNSMVEPQETKAKEREKRSILLEKHAERIGGQCHIVITHALATSRLHYYNTLYVGAGLPLKTAQKLQLVQNLAECMRMGASRLHHISTGFG